MRPAGQGGGIGVEGVIVGQRVFQVTDQLGQLLRELVGRILAAILLQRHGRALVTARRAAQAQIDAAGMQAGKQAELLRDFQRRIVR